MKSMPCKFCGRLFLLRKGSTSLRKHCYRPECADARRLEKNERAQLWREKRKLENPDHFVKENRQRQERASQVHKPRQPKWHYAKCGHLAPESYYFNCPACLKVKANFAEEYLYWE
jgi:hypothetical protein